MFSRNEEQYNRGGFPKTLSSPVISQGDFIKFIIEQFKF